jgi:predicted permease
MEIPLLRGRLFDDRDAPGGPHVAVISDSLARTRWPGQDPIGKPIQFGGMDGDMRPFTVIGVVGDIREASLADAPKPTFYASYRQRPRAAWRMNLLFRADVEPATLVAPLRRALHEMNPQVPPRFRTIESVVRDSMAARRFVLVLIGVFGGAALVLATLGVYSVIAYLVTQRRREIAIRMAIGAQNRAVQNMVLRQGITLAGVGILIGAAGALATTRLLASLLYGVAPTDPVAFLGVACVLVAVAALASWLPARQAASIAPAELLRG